MRLLLLAGVFTGCDHTNDSFNTQTRLSVTTEIASKAPIGGTSFTSGSQLGLFVTSGILGNNYDGVASNANVLATLGGSAWAIIPDVSLSPSVGTVYGYYPYSAGATDGTAVAVDHTTQTDYLYCDPATGISSAASNANLNFRHALALVQFNLHRSGYTRAGVLTRIDIRNKVGKTALASAGALNISTGIVTPTPGQNAAASSGALSMVIPAAASSDESTYPKIMTLPVTTLAAGGDIQVDFTIDAAVYTFDVPASTAWIRATKNTYSITLQGTGLVIGSSVVIDPWTVGTNGTGVLM